MSKVVLPFRPFQLLDWYRELAGQLLSGVKRPFLNREVYTSRTIAIQSQNVLS